jgi:pimeloyl-ACP methyl ester carboxylesterase
MLLGAACGGSDSATTSDPRATFTACQGDYECATIEVPVDYGNPGGPKLSLALLRAPAKDPAARLGAVVVNPGGPGLAFVDQLATTYPVLSAGFSEATTKFDVVTFDWRGIGRSAPIGCNDDGLLDHLRAVDLTLETPGSVQAAGEVRTALLACLGKGDQQLLAAMNTENAARDLDRIREALGEEKLDYLGFSYGTWLGATYATLFPERVRAFALDSATVLTGDLEGDIDEQAASYELGFQRFFEACARDATCKLRGTGAAAADPAAVAARFDAIVAKSKTGGQLPAGGPRELSLVNLQLALADGLRNADWPQLASDLAEADAGNATKLLDTADVVAGRQVDGHYDTSLLGLLAITCLDQRFGAIETVDAFQAFAAKQRAAHPRGAAAALLPWAMCTAWPYQRAGARAAIAAATAPKALVVAGKFDPITSYEQGPQLVSLLANGSSLLTYEGDGHAAALHSSCVRDVVTQFLLSPTAPLTKTSCPAE